MREEVNVGKVVVEKEVDVWMNYRVDGTEFNGPGLLSENNLVRSITPVRPIEGITDVLQI